MATLNTGLPDRWFEELCRIRHRRSESVVNRVNLETLSLGRLRPILNMDVER